MNSSSPASKLPLWVFLVSDAVLITAAALIARHGPQPYTKVSIIAISLCLFLGTAIALIPLVARYERLKNEMLDDRQRALEALARTITSSAEQISIAANGLHEIAELAQRNVKHAEQLPHKLQEKIAEFQAQLANANDNEKEELEKQLEELRSSETERLQTLSDRLTRTTTDFAKLETTVHQHVVAANEALSKLSFGTASAIGKAQAAAEQALGQARQEAARSLGDASGAAVKAIETAKESALKDLSAQFERHIAGITAAAKELSAVVEKLGALPPAAASAAATAPTGGEPAVTASPQIAAAEVAATEPSSPATEPVATPPKRARKPRREEPAPVHEAAPPVAAAEEPPPVTEPAPAEPVPATPAAAPETEPPPIAAESIPEIAPVAPETKEPFSVANPAETPSAAAAGPAPSAPAAAEEPAPAAEPTDTAKPARKRAAKKPEDDQPALGLELEEPRTNGGEGGPATIERVLSSDGATRLIVTAYIGIGNRLFIRGAGPGLSWDKGTPLQFVSIGKWRWETNDANGPVQVKLLKNDEQECAALGSLTIEPGHQHEVTATF